MTVTLRENPDVRRPQTNEEWIDEMREGESGRSEFIRAKDALNTIGIGLFQAVATPGLYTFYWSNLEVSFSPNEGSVVLRLYVDDSKVESYTLLIEEDFTLDDIVEIVYLASISNALRESRKKAAVDPFDMAAIVEASREACKHKGEVNEEDYIMSSDPNWQSCIEYWGIDGYDHWCNGCKSVVSVCLRLNDKPSGD